jgi:hypothetical protein
VVHVSAQVERRREARRVRCRNLRY